MDLIVGRRSTSAGKAKSICIFNHDYDAKDPELKDVEILVVFFKHGHKTNEVLEKLGVHSHVIGWVDRTPGELTTAIASWLTPNIRVSPDLGVVQKEAQKPKRHRPKKQSPKPVDE